MTACDYIAFLEEMGVKLEVADGSRLLASPARAVGPGTVEVLKAHKVEIIAVLVERQRSSTHSSRTAESEDSVDAPKVFCTRCQGTAFVDVVIHGGRSTRRDCARCGRFLNWPLWYGEARP